MPKYNLKWQIKLSHYFWNENNLKPEAFFLAFRKDSAQLLWCGFFKHSMILFAL